MNPFEANGKVIERPGLVINIESYTESRGKGY